MDGVHHQAALHGGEAAQAAVAGLELEQHQAVGAIAQTRQPVAAERGAEEAERAHRGHEVAGELPALPQLGQARPRFLLHEVAHGLADEPLLVAERRIHGEEIEPGAVGGHGASRMADRSI